VPLVEHSLFITMFPISDIKKAYIYSMLFHYFLCEEIQSFESLVIFLPEKYLIYKIVADLCKSEILLIVHSVIITTTDFYEEMLQP